MRVLTVRLATTLLQPVCLRCVEMGRGKIGFVARVQVHINSSTTTITTTTTSTVWEQMTWMMRRPASLRLAPLHPWLKRIT